MEIDDSSDEPPGGRSASTQNRLFNLARSATIRLPESWFENRPVLLNKILYPAAVLVFAFLTPSLSAVLGLPITLLGFNLSESQADLGFALILIGSFLPIFLLVWLWLWIVEQRPLWTTGMIPPVIRPYLRGLLIGMLLLGGIVLVLALFGYVMPENTNQDQVLGMTIAGSLLVLSGWMVQGAAEEILARGFLMPILGVRWGPWPAVIVSSLFFSVLHLANPNLNALSLVNLFLFGFLAALYALYEGGLWGVFALHAIWNWAQGNLFGFSVSGLNVESSIIYDLMEAGPDWITGGLFGPEGGIIVTLVLLSGIFMLAAISRSRCRGEIIDKIS